MAITIFLTFTPLGMIPLYPINPTTVHIPVILGACLIGIGPGLILGLTFGVSSLIHSIVIPQPASVIFWNPLISVVPRILCGLVAALIFKLSMKLTKNQAVSFVLSGLIGSLSNTIFVLGSVYLFEAQGYAGILGVNTPEEVLNAILATVAVNGVPEAIFAAIITLACGKIIMQFQKNKKI